MTDRATVEPWVQLPMFPPNVVELTLKIGIVQSADHIQFQIEARDALDGNLLAMWSRPHWGYENRVLALAEACHELRNMLEIISEPFPNL